MSRERWRPVVGYEGLYEVSDQGRVRSLDRQARVRGGGLRAHLGRVLRPYCNPYPLVVLSRGGAHKTCKVPRLVAEAFIPNPDCRREVNHIDCDPLNNRASNLEWATALENTRHAQINGKMARKLTPQDVVQIRALASVGAARVAIAAQFGINRSCVYKIITREAWAHI